VDAVAKLPSISDYPLLLGELQTHDSAADELFARRLVQTTVQAVISDDACPPGEAQKVDDEVMARAVKESYRGYNGRKPHGVGLLLSRVPVIVRGWAKEAG
jgi:hypothetical protein